MWVVEADICRFAVPSPAARLPRPLPARPRMAGYAAASTLCHLTASR